MRKTEVAPVQAVHRTMRALEWLADASGGVTVVQLAEALGVEKSIASRLLSSLHAQGWLLRDGVSERYELSLRLVSLAARYTDRLGFPAVCHPILTELSRRTGELVQLSLVQESDLVLVDHAQPKRRGIGVSVPTLGTNIVLHATASGKAWLAALDSERAASVALAHGLRLLTERTLVSIDALLADLAGVREHGYATAKEEYLEHVNAVAVAVGGERFGATVGTLAVSAPAHRLPDSAMAELADTTRTAAAQLAAVWPTAPPISAARSGSRKGRSS